MTNGTVGAWVSTFAGEGTTQLTVSESLITGNGTGLYQGGAGATLFSLGNNTVTQNAFNTSGTIMPLTPM